MVHYFGSSAPTIAGAVTLQVDIFTNYGRQNEACKSVTLRLGSVRDVVTVGEIFWSGDCAQTAIDTGDTCKQ